MNPKITATLLIPMFMFGCSTVQESNHQTKTISSADTYVSVGKPQGDVEYISFISHAKIDLQPSENSSYIEDITCVLVKYNGKYIILWDLKEMSALLINTDCTFSKFINQYENKFTLNSTDKSNAKIEASNLAQSRLEERCSNETLMDVQNRIIKEMGGTSPIQ